jgi:diguanylate cyclase (GGDEF)-like protein/PAS domain S-box-containing protein
MTEIKKAIPKRVLVVEDETIVSMDLQNSLKCLGYEVVGAAVSGPEAIAKAEASRPDLVLMDIILKGEMDGVQTAETIHARLGIPVIFLTACADEKTLHRAKVTEPFGYMIKPFEERELHSHIEIALYKHRMEQQLRESEERYSLATQGANDGLWDWDIRSQEIYFSPRWKSMLGFADNQIGKSPMDWFGRIHPADRASVEKSIAGHLKGEVGHFECEYRILDADGTYRWVLCRGLARRDGSGKAYRMAGSQTDITERKVYNPLTGLPNQILFVDRVEQALRCVKANTKNFAVAVIEIQEVKTIASSLGHVIADRLVGQAARKIQACLSTNDTAAHLGNDDFVFLFEDVGDGKQAAIAASRLHRALEEPFQIDGQTIYVTAHVGIVVCNHEYAQPEELIRDAYAAMQRAKTEGKNHFEIFNTKMRSSAVARLRMETDLRSALDRQEFRIHYQPITDLKTGALAGFEALVRWQRLEAMMLPKDFLSIAESTDIILPLESWVLRESCIQMARWRNRGGEPPTINVNLCPKHYMDPGLIRELRDVLQSSGLEPHRLRLEITESALMDDSDAVFKNLSEIKAMNVQLHLDDFGTGYSSLSYLNRFPIDTLKIDRTFVGKLGMCEETWKIVQAIVNLAKNLEMESIAEGIENIMQLRMLQTLRCNYGQGYYFAKPMTAEAVENMLIGNLPWEVVFENTRPRQFPHIAEVC